MTMHRRGFLQVSAIGGGMVLGFSLLGCKGKKSEPRKEDTPPPPDKNVEAPVVPAEPTDLNAWVRIAPDDTITLSVTESEMGQGVLTALAMILAEELDADWSKVRSEHALYDKSKYGEWMTGGSTSVRKDIEQLRQVGAAARSMLIEAAAKRLGVAASECRTESSAVLHAASNRRLRYGEIAHEAAAMAAPESPKLKDKKDFRVIGKAQKRLDTPAKVNGSAEYGIDVKRPGMLIAQVAHSPYFGGKLKSFDATEAEKVPGVQKVIEIPTGVAVVADHYWAAKKGRDALKIEWDQGPGKGLSNASITRKLREVVKKGKVARTEGDATATLAQAKRKLEAVYETPYLAHAPMEPLNCTAEVEGERCEIWAGTQTPMFVQQAASGITGIAADKIIVHTTMLGGGFGRRAQQDFIVDAVHTAKAMGKPVKVVWSREDDITQGMYRPVTYNELVGAVDDEGWPSLWIHRIASPSIMHVFGPLKDGLDATAIEGAANLPYAIPNLQVTWGNPELPVPTWFWRSVGSSQNAFVTECFLDELARLGGKDPVEVRRRLLANHPRHARVLEVAVEKAGWGRAPGEGRALGVAVHESFGSIVAQVAEISVDQGKVRVHKVVCAVDCGEVVNPDTVTAQMEGGIVFGLTAALYGKIDIADGKAVQTNFHEYSMLRMPEMPVVETHIVAKGDAMGGIGEVGVPPIAPAVCNALFALTGKPVRKLPIGKIA